MMKGLENLDKERLNGLVLLSHQKAGSVEIYHSLQCLKGRFREDGGTSHGCGVTGQDANFYLSIRKIFTL